MSTKLLVALRAKYSSPMFRPPITAIAPSAMKSLLCIRWLSLLNSQSEASESACNALARTAERIEEPYLDVGECRQPTKHGVPTHGVEIIDQQSDSHAAQRRVAEVAHQQASRTVVLDQIVLNVERVTGSAHQLDSGVERVVAARHQPKTAETRPGRGVVGDTGQRAVERRRAARASTLRPAASAAHRMLPVRRTRAARKQCQGGSGSMPTISAAMSNAVIQVPRPSRPPPLPTPPGEASFE